MELKFGQEKRFFEFMADLDEKDKIGILCHNDSDGMISAIIASKVLGKIDYIRFLDYKPGLIGSLIPDIKKKKINKILILDYLAEGEKEAIKEISKFSEVLIIDHHPWISDINSERITSLIAEDDYPASYICHYLFSKIQSIDSRFAALGIVADRPHKYQQKNMQEVFRDYNLKKEDIDLWNSLNLLANALIYFKGKEDRIYDIFMRTKNFDLTEIKQYSSLIDKEIEKYRNDYQKHKEEHGNLIFYYYKPKYSINSSLITEISLKNWNKILVFACEFEGIIRISARNQSREIDCSKLLQESIKDIPDSNAGGHSAAAGGRIPIEYLEKFKENLFRAYEKIK